MSVGIKIYNKSNQVLINSNYKNIALISTIYSYDIPEQEINLGNRPVIIVEELMDENEPVCDAGLKYENGVYYLNIKNPQNSTQRFFVFGDPDNSKMTSKAGLIIYKNGTNEVAFDSRLEYLKILGEIYNDMPLSFGAYGIIRRCPASRHHTEEWGVTRGGLTDLYIKRWHEAFCISNDKIKIYDHYTQNSHQRMYGRRSNHYWHYNSPYKPLLVDLSSLLLAVI